MEKDEEYLICNKEKILAKFVWTSRLGDILDPHIMEVVSYLPDFISRDLLSWLESRTPPKQREHMSILLDRLGLHGTKNILDYSKGLSLTDTLWIRKASESLKWDSINLYDNEFDEVISKIAFDGGLYGEVMSATSPEFGTNGMLAKCWVREVEGIYLKKGGTSGARNAGFEPYSEVLSSQILDALMYDHIHYTCEQFRGRLVSSCKLMTSKEVSMLPIYAVCNYKSISSILEYYERIGDIDSVLQMFVFDYLVVNSDRHASNFAVLVDSETFSPIKMAPIYDNGVGVLNYYMVGDDIEWYLKNYTPALYESFEELARFAKKHLSRPHNVNRLINFQFDRTKVPGYSNEKIDYIESFIQKRVREFLSW